jgi:SAM-dependent methyltransferase
MAGLQFSLASVNQPRLEDIVEWDVANWSRALKFWTDHSAITVTAQSRALELGARHGGVSLWLACLGFNVVCSDIGYPAATATARALHTTYGIEGRVTYERADATDIPIDGPFDVVCFKSVLGAVGKSGIERQRRAVAEMHRVLKPGGEVWFAENLRASPVHRILRHRFVPWADSWRYVTISELEEMFGRFKELEVAAIGFSGAFGRTETQRRALSLVDAVVLTHLVPPEWRYIAIGVARK